MNILGLRKKVEPKEAMLWKNLEDDKVLCHLCYRKCLIPKGMVGVCKVRKNIDGKLYSLVYGKLTSMNVDPIEKKPLFHFHPGSEVLSISTVGCNFQCMFCCNWVISQEEEILGKSTTPEEVVNYALKYGADGISYTYNEPTVFFEFAYDTAKLAKKHGLFNTFVTNGYMTIEAVDIISSYLDAATVDFKASGDPKFHRKFMSVGNIEPVFDTLREMKKKEIFIEITDLIVPKYGDNMEYVRKLAKFTVENLGPEIPFHLIRFFPSYLMTDLPSTPVETLEKAARIAKDEGLHYVYIGNAPGHPLENTYCPNCNKLLIQRYGFEIIKWDLTEDNRCPTCKTKINVKGTFKFKSRRWTSIF